MDNIEQKIIEYVDGNKEKFIKFLQNLIKIPSVTGNEKKAQEFVRDKIAGYGFKTEFLEPDLKKMFELFPEVAQIPSIGEEGLDMPLMTEDKFTYEQLMASPYDRLKSYKERPNLIGRLKGTGGGRSLILNGHIDTVPVGDISKWHHDPFGGEIVDGKIYGRGAVDMKGGVAAIVCASEALTALKVPLAGDLTIHTVVNEEHAGGGALGNIVAGEKADAVILAEPHGYKTVSHGSGGGVYWEVTVKGKEAHAGYRWRDNQAYGISAIEKAALVIDNLIKMESSLNNENTMISLCVGKIHGGTYSTATAFECRINGVAYFSPYLGTGKAGIVKVKKLLKEAVLGVDDPWLKANPPTIKFQHYDDAYILPPDKTEIRDMTADVVCDVLGERLPFAIEGGACDARHYYNQGNIPAIVYGPGDVSLAHSTDEYNDLNEYIESIKVLAITTYRWCNGV